MTPAEPILGGATLAEVLTSAGFDPTAAGEAPTAPRGQLMNPYPNPFNPSTKLSYRLPEGGNLDLAVYDLQGRRLRTLRSGWRDAGRGEVTWNGRDEAGRALPSGIYFAKLLLDGEAVDSRRLALVK